jgi:hypothetical protein
MLFRLMKASAARTTMYRLQVFTPHSTKSHQILPTTFIIQFNSIFSRSAFSRKHQGILKISQIPATCSPFRPSNFASTPSKPKLSTSSTASHYPPLPQAQLAQNQRDRRFFPKAPLVGLFCSSLSLFSH